MDSQTASPRLLRVFLCHSSADTPTVQTLYRRLKACNVQPWLDKEDLVGGQNWDLEIRKAVRECDVFIACLTADFIVKEGYGQKEIKLALDTAMEKPEVANYFIPLTLEACDLPERLKHIHEVKYFEKDGFDQLIKALQFRVDRKNTSLHAGIAPINPSPRRRAATGSRPRTSPVASSSITETDVTTLQGLTPQHGGPRSEGVKRGITIAIALALIGSIAALVWSLVFKVPSDVRSPGATSTPTSAQSGTLGATITFDALGGSSNVIEVYPGASNALQDKTYAGTYYSGETVPIVCETKGRTITSNPATGEQYRQSDEWYKLQTPPGTQPEYASAVYADEHGSVLQC